MKAETTIFYKKDTETFELLFVGDTSFGENYQEKEKQKGRESILEKFGYAYSLEKMKPIMIESDWVVANLETPLTHLAQSPYVNQKEYVHWSHIEKAPESLAKHNISLVSIANNHSFDYGVEGYKQTIEALKKNNISMMGAGGNINEAAKPFIGQVDFGHKIFKFAIISAFEISSSYHKIYQVYADDNKPGLMPLDLELIASQVKNLKETDPDIFVILFPHWGNNYQWRTEKQAQLAKKLIASGVDMIIGHGSHMIQEFDNQDNRLIVYSLGNFMFNSPGRYEKLKAPPYSYIAKLVVSLANNKFELVMKLYPIVTNNKLTNYQPRFLKNSEYKDLLLTIEGKQSNTSNMVDATNNKDQYGHYLSLPVIRSNSGPKNTTWVGMICHSETLRSFDKDKDISRWMYRAILIDHELVKHGLKLIAYQPKDVDITKETVEGYVLEEGIFKKMIMPMPKINYDWYIGNKAIDEKPKFSYKSFILWALKKGYEIYPDPSIRKVACNKLKNHELFLKYNSDIVPATTTFTNDIQLLEAYFKLSGTVFIKPIKGNMGNDIFSIHKEKNYFLMNYFDHKEKISIKFDSVSDIISYITKKIKNEQYLIQEGVDVVRYDGSVYDVRVIMVSDGKNWHFLSKARVGVRGSDLSNVHQGGYRCAAETMLSKTFSCEQAVDIMDKIKKITMDLTEKMAHDYPNMNEIAFDMLIDKVGAIYIAEMNVKPGLAGTVSPEEFADFLKMTAQEQNICEDDFVRHGAYLARFLISKYKNKDAQRKNIKKIGFDDIKKTSECTHLVSQEWINLIYKALKNKQYHIKKPSKKYLSDQSAFENEPKIIFISISDRDAPAQVYRGNGKDLLEAINAALSNIKKSLDPTFDFKGVKLDIVKEVLTLKDYDISQPLPMDHSLEGLAFDEEINLAYLPEQLLANRLISKRAVIRPRRMFFNKPELTDQTIFTLFFFKTHSFYQSDSKQLTLYRGHRMFFSLEPDLLLASAISAGSYLQRCVKENGDFVYEYFPRRQKESHRYNVLRHAGSIYSMLELYEVTHDQALLQAAKCALLNLVDRAQPLAGQEADLLCIVENDLAKLGANSLALLALSKYKEVTNDNTFSEVSNKLALWIKSIQGDSGDFLVHKQIYSMQKNTDYFCIYYPGEAIFSLACFYQLEPNALWLQMAENAANHIIQVRDKDVKTLALGHEHWLLYGLGALYRFTHNTAYLEHSLKICQAIMHAQYQKPDPMDYFGSFYKVPRSTPCATRAEGLYAAYNILKDSQYHSEAEAVLESLIACVRFQLQTQFQEERALYLPNPRQVLGGFSAGLVDYSIRIDYVQHNLSSLLGLYKILSR